MKKLSKDHDARRDEIAAELRLADRAIDEALVEINGLIDEKLTPAIERYNAALTEVETLRDEVVGEMDEYISARSEKWQESDAASNYNDWKGEWENLDTSALDVVEPLESPTTDHADSLDGLPHEPNKD
jgi:hypothetical protein